MDGLLVLLVSQPLESEGLLMLGASYIPDLVIEFLYIGYLLGHA